MQVTNATVASRARILLPDSKMYPDQHGSQHEPAALGLSCRLWPFRGTIR
jgi:hypothetical protein